MKKYILSALCSGLVVPGLGQILNNEIKKGLLLLCAVFIVFVAGVVKLALVIMFLLSQSPTTDPMVIMERIKGEHLLFLWVLIGLFAVIWLYSVVDAFRTGKRPQDMKGGKLL
jgi:predicted acyltransferase